MTPRKPSKAKGCSVNGKPRRDCPCVEPQGKTIRAWAGRLPDGKETRVQSRYVKEWRAFAAPLQKALGLRLHAFDPGVAFVGEKWGEYVQLPGWVVARLNKVLSGTFTPGRKG